MRMKSMPFSEQLRDAIRRCGKSRYRIFQETGIAESTLSKFMNHKGGLSTPALDKLAQCIGLSVHLESPTKQKPKGK